MKKVLTLLVGLVAVFALSACGGEEATVPTFDGIDVLVYLTQGDEFDPLAGVTATDTIDGDITADIQVSGTECLLLEDGKATTAPLECKLTYTVENSNGLSAMKLSTVTVEKGEPVAGENQIVNSDFSTDNLAVWVKGEWDGGSAAVSIENEMMKVEVLEASWNVAPRMHQGGLVFENGKTYTVTFDAYALEARPLSIQVGTLVDGAPWFISYADQQLVDLTTEAQTFTFTFTVSEVDTTAGILSFEFGDFGAIEGYEPTATTVYIDNVLVQELS